MEKKCPKCHGYLYRDGWHTNCPGESIGREADETICIMTQPLRLEIEKLQKIIDSLKNRMYGAICPVCETQIENSGHCLCTREGEKPI